MCSSVSTDSFRSVSKYKMIQLQILAAVDTITHQCSDPFLASNQSWSWQLPVICKEHSAWACLVIWLLILKTQPREKATREDSAAVWLAEY